MKRAQLIILVASLISGCGGLGLEEAAETLADALEGRCLVYKTLAGGEPASDDDDSTEANSESEATDCATASDDSTTTDQEDTGNAGNSGDSGNSGGSVGIYTLPEEEKGLYRTFIGTFENQNTIYACTSSFYNGYDLPNVVRVYQHDDLLDFEDNQGNLTWVARLYQDMTFDFSILFGNQFGYIDNELTCTCSYDAGYYNYTSDQITCACEPSKAGDWTCEMIYTMK